MPAVAPCGAPASEQRAAAQTYRSVKSLDDVRAAMTAATAAGKPVMLEFYADWAPFCQVMHREVFPDARVQTLLAKLVWLRADVTANDATDKALLKPFGVTGVPQILFFRRDGQQRKDLLLAGYSKPEDLVQRLEQALR